MTKTWVVMFETYLRQIKTWSFLFMILGPFLMFGLTAGLSYLTADSAKSSQQMAVVSQSTPLRQAYLKSHRDGLNTRITTTNQAKKAVKANHLAGYLVLSVDQQAIRGDFHGTQALSGGQRAQVQNFLSAYQAQTNTAQAKLTAKQQAVLSRTPTLASHISTKSGTANTVKIASFWAFVTLLYIILITYSSITAQEIAADKGTKLMEVIFSSTTATSYFIGKIGGMLLMILTQIAVYLAGGAAAYQWASNSRSFKPLLTSNRPLIDGILHNFLSINLLYLFLGVVIFILLAAYSGALVSKAEDASKAAQPTVMLGMLVFFATFPFQNNLDAIPVKILSYVPFFSSYFMPLRLINGTTNTWEVVISLVILLAAIAVGALMIGKHYQRLMLQNDNRSLWQQLLHRK
ncbi:ABC-type Na+ efflux pump, permease component [Levilactobacillus senmaizukei DSM 21775 = NBRC 103853]|uniref:ABC-type Na+ efflux pump, permease component n=1 Tax=Levilactobacillus senmaizukei DSM 21775 = NBRC 103853 TaxID=1423803 RepID=A0A0R2DTE7_9LACO|nr:ABC transporter permease [Levilactobacillus senmaizukei]KRN03389.1 ABC-type Na+ efflux pump, permease component [Levilactobacillus senmaizukei DSM 21775 = NBRC 103853]